MIDELCGLFEQRHYKRMTADTEGIRIYYEGADGGAEAVLIFDCDRYKLLDLNIIRRLKSQIMWKLITAGYIDTEFLCIFTGMEVTNGMKELCTEEGTNWIIDKTHGRLIIYENQESDYMNLRSSIEAVIESACHARHKKNTHLPALCNTILVMTNIIIYLICEWKIYADDSMSLYRAGALDGALVMAGEYYRLAASMFLHLGISHLFNNMLMLFYLGSYLERILGRVKYLLLYFLSGIIAGLASIGYNILTGSAALSVGASGAVFGVSGALAYIIIINKGKVENISRRQMVIFLLLSLYGGFNSQNVDNAAHIGGLAAGFMLAAVLYGFGRIRIRKAQENRNGAENED